MDIKQMLADLIAERDRIDQAIAALQQLDTTSERTTEPARTAAKKIAAPAKKGRGGRRQMSAAGRKRISEMMKRRWAERRKKAGA